MEYYRSSVRELQRLTSKGASPIYAMFGETLDGVSTIRAYGDQGIMEEANRDLLSGLLRPNYLQQCSGAWLSMRLQFMGAFIVGGTAGFAVWEFGGANVDPVKAGIIGP